MKLEELVKRLGLKVCVGETELDRDVSGGHVSDLLSDVMAHCKKDYVWVTIQIHPNIVAVAVLKELAAIVLVNGREAAEETIGKAAQERIPVLTTPLSAFELVGRLYELGIKGS